MVLDVLHTHEHEHDSEGGGCDSNRGCGNGLEKVYPTTAVRWGYMKNVGEFTRQPDMKFTCGAKVVIQTERGIEMGEQLSLSCNGCSNSVDRDQIRRYIENSGREYFRLGAGRILREATAQDLMECEHIQQESFATRRFCQEHARSLGLEMKVVECEHLFGGERMIYYFTAETRVDFRQLVRELAEEYHTRIEMRQVGARDEARLVADYETCGRECCCKNFLKTFRPVTMRMAKLQKATLEKSKVSGRCGRLKCCLRYEHVSYQELDRLLPRVGASIRTKQGEEGVIVARQILTQLLQIEQPNGSKLTVMAEDLIGAPDAEPRERQRPTPEADEGPADAVMDDTDGVEPAEAPEPSEAAGDSDSERPRRRRRRRRPRRPPGEGAPQQPG